GARARRQGDRDGPRARRRLRHPGGGRRPRARAGGPGRGRRGGALGGGAVRPAGARCVRRRLTVPRGSGPGLAPSGRVHVHVAVVQRKVAGSRPCRTTAVHSSSHRSWFSATTAGWRGSATAPSGSVPKRSNSGGTGTPSRTGATNISSGIAAWTS